MRLLFEKGRGENPILGALVILVISLCAGLTANHISTKGLPLFASEASLRAWVPPTVKYITVEQARKRATEQGAIFLDARSPEEYQEGHIEGATNLPVDDYGQRYPLLRRQLRAAPVIVCYCESISCDEAARLCALLAGAGYPRVEFMFAGWEEWQQYGGLAQETMP